MNRSQVFSTHLALLRGINLADKNRLPMKDLVEIFTAAGCIAVRTYIQSGNVIFSAPHGALEGLPGRITGQIEERFGYKIPVILRTARELGDAILNNPFLKAGKAESTLHLLFLAGMPDPQAVRNLDPDLANDILQIFADANLRGSTVLLASHDRDLIARSSRRIIALDHGCIVEEKQASPEKAAPRSESIFVNW